MADRKAQRRHVRDASRRRRRGGDNRAPVHVQRVARGVAVKAEVAKGGVNRAFAGDRPFLLVLVGLLVLGVLMLSGPFQGWLDGRDRVDNLELKLTALDADNARLAARAEDLHDPDTIELLAREEFGLVQPGDVAYVVVPPENARPQIAPAQIAPAAFEQTAPRAWYVRAWDAMTGIFR